MQPQRCLHCGAQACFDLLGPALVVFCSNSCRDEQTETGSARATDADAREQALHDWQEQQAETFAREYEEAAANLCRVCDKPALARREGKVWCATCYLDHYKGDDVTPEWVTAPVCDCGAKVANTTHAFWCALNT